MIRTRSLTKHFGAVHAVRGITLDIAPGDTLDIAPGELMAVLGPNGAGKTTTIRMLTTPIAPTSGTATVVDHDVVAEPGEVRRAIGYVGQGNGAGHTQRVRDELDTQGVIYGLDRRTARRRTGELLAALDLGELAGRTVSALSGGQRRRLDVAMGLVHAPSLLFLDEPSTGLDPQNRANLWDHVLRMRERHAMTITHYMDEADSMAERVIVVDRGEVIADDTADALKAELAGDRVVVTATSVDDAARLARLAARLPGGRDFVVDGLRMQARVSDGPAALPELLAAGVPVATAQVHRPTLDDVFLALTGRSLRETHTPTPRPPTSPRRQRHDHALRSRSLDAVDSSVEPAARHRHRDGPRAAPGAARPVLGDVRAGAAPGLPGPVRAAAGRLARRAGRGAGRRRLAVVRPGDPGDDRAVRDLGDRGGPALRVPDRRARADARHTAVATVAAARAGVQGDGAARRAGRADRRGDAAVRVHAVPGRRGGRPAAAGGPGDAERALFADNLTAPAVLGGWLAALATAAVGLTIGVRAMRASAE